MIQLLRKAHSTDYAVRYEQDELRKLCCIHCGQPFEYGRAIMYTRLATNKDKLIWWHARRLLSDDDPCYITKKENE